MNGAWHHKSGSDTMRDIEQIFDVLRASRPEFHKKLVMVKGDCSLPKLGLSNSDYEILIQQSMVYISTAYSNCHLKEIRECFYDPPFDMDEDIINYLCTADEATIELLKPKILDKWPNTYTFTKSITENILRKTAADLPISIVRPSQDKYLMIKCAIGAGYLDFVSRLAILFSFMRSCTIGSCRQAKIVNAKFSLSGLTEHQRETNSNTTPSTSTRISVSNRLRYHQDDLLTLLQTGNLSHRMSGHHFTGDSQPNPIDI
uniref:Fatty acyl-CoA reductase n=1 Tax=Timema tahoe TaxID=61484 RepID=A0A7R9IR45_9NEOP|nr:unnamed protein product [Timema tahoe]